MTLKILKTIFFLSIVYLVQVNFITGLFYPLNKINIILPIVIFLIVLYSTNVALAYTLVLTVFQSQIVATPLIIYIFILPIAVLIVLKIYYKFFTNKSLYSIILLNGILLIIYQVLSIAGFLIYHLFLHKTLANAINFSLITNVFVWQLVLSTVFIIIAFIIVNQLSTKLKTVYIDSNAPKRLFYQ